MSLYDEPCEPWDWLDDFCYECYMHLTKCVCPKCNLCGRIIRSDDPDVCDSTGRPYCSNYCLRTALGHSEDPDWENCWLDGDGQ